MTSESTGLRRQDFELRGWKEICEFLGCDDGETAKGMLRRMGILDYDGNKPVLNIIAYKKTLLNRGLRRRSKK